MKRRDVTAEQMIALLEMRLAEQREKASTGEEKPGVLLCIPMPAGHTWRDVLSQAVLDFNAGNPIGAVVVELGIGDQAIDRMRNTIDVLTR